MVTNSQAAHASREGAVSDRDTLDRQDASRHRPHVTACRMGLQTYFASVAEFVTSLPAAQQRGQFIARLQFYTKHTVLIQNEMDYLRLAPGGRTGCSNS